MQGGSEVGYALHVDAGRIDVGLQADLFYEVVQGGDTAVVIHLELRNVDVAPVILHDKVLYPYLTVVYAGFSADVVYDVSALLPSVQVLYGGLCHYSLKAGVAYGQMDVRHVKVRPVHGPVPVRFGAPVVYHPEAETVDANVVCLEEFDIRNLHRLFILILLVLGEHSLQVVPVRLVDKEKFSVLDAEVPDHRRLPAKHADGVERHAQELCLGNGVRLCQLRSIRVEVGIVVRPDEVIYDDGVEWPDGQGGELELAVYLLLKDVKRFPGQGALHRRGHQKDPEDDDCRQDYG